MNEWKRSKVSAHVVSLNRPVPGTLDDGAVLLPGRRMLFVEVSAQLRVR